LQPQRDLSDWDAAVDHWRGLRGLEENHRFGMTDLHDLRKEEIDADYSETYRRAQAALKAIIAAPASTISAVADKLALLVEDDPDNSDLAVLRTLEADCRRLAGRDATLVNANGSRAA